MKILFETIAGSHLYGTNHKDSDIDIRQVFVPSVEEAFGLNNYSDTRDCIVENTDTVMYSLRKFIHLAQGCNPNILELLYAENNVWNSHYKGIWGHFIERNRRHFLSKEIAVKFVGYARSQYTKLVAGKSTSDRGPGRIELIEKWGFDCKNAMNLIRIIDEGIELVTTYHLEFPLKEAQTYIDIKEGKWPLEKIKDYMDYGVEKIDALVASSNLPNKADYTFWNTVCVDIHKELLLS